MATEYTPNINLGKQTDHSDKFDMTVITDNMDILDTTIADILARLEALEGKE